MALKFNGRTINSLPLRFRGATGFEYAETNKASQRNMFAGEGITDKASGTPAGHLYPSAWIWPQKSGTISSFLGLKGNSDATATIAGGVARTSSLSGSGDLTATGFTLANMGSALSGAGDLAADILATGLLNLSAIGSGGLTATITSSQIVFINAALTGGSVLSADWTALAVGVADIGNNTGTIYGIPYAPAILSANITPFTDLSPQNLANAVWTATKAEYVDPATMGYELKSKLKKTDFIALKD